MTKPTLSSLATTVAVMDEKQDNLKAAFDAHQKYTSESFDDLKDAQEKLFSIMRRVEAQTTKTNGTVQQQQKDHITITNNLLEFKQLYDTEIPPITRFMAKLGGMWMTIGVIGAILSFIAYITVQIVNKGV
jgi:hypothetical protein